MIDFNLWGDSDEKKEIDFAALKATCNSNITTILEQWQPGGRIVNGEYVCGTKFGGKGESCSTNIRTGVGADFGAGESWGDAIDLIAQIEDISMSESARRLQDFLSCGSTELRPTPVIPQQSPEERYAVGQKIALGLWVESEQCPTQHPYLVKKQINPDSGIRLHQPTGNILIPLYDEHGVLWSVQRISPDGEKKINHCGRLSGSFYIIGGERDIVYICEGYATAQTVAMATGKTAVMAVSAGNLSNVGEKISKMFPTCQLIFAADNDQKPDSDENPGIKAANNAVKYIGRGVVMAPPFPAGKKGDWNDYAIEYGGKATRELLSIKGINYELPLFMDIFDYKLVSPQYLIDKLIETPVTGCLFGSHSAGKSYIAIDWALHVATGKDWNGRKVKQGPVIYIVGEGRVGVRRRVEVWCIKHGIKPAPGQFIFSTRRVEISVESIHDLVDTIDEVAKTSGNPAMIVIDTLARSLPAGADENSNKDMQAWVNQIDNIRDRYSSVVLVVHHTGHDGFRQRGASCMPAAYEFEAGVDKAKRNLVNTKMKDGEEWEPIHFDFESIFVDDPSGNWKSSVVNFDFNYNSKINKYSANLEAAVKSLHEAVQSDGLSGSMCFIQTWRDIYKSCMGDVSDKKKNTSFNEQVAIMEERDLIVVTGNKVAPVKLKEDLETESMFRGLLRPTK